MGAVAQCLPTMSKTLRLVIVDILKAEEVSVRNGDFFYFERERSVCNRH